MGTKYRLPHLLKSALLHHFIIQQASHVQLGRVLDSLGRQQHWTNRASAVKAFGEAPLALVQLANAARDVIAGRVPQYIVHRLVAGDIFARLADDDG